MTTSRSLNYQTTCEYTATIKYYNIQNIQFI